MTCAGVEFASFNICDMRFNYKTHLENCGFTLIELLVVIAIIGLLASIVITSLSSARRKARDVRRLSDMEQITIALGLFFDDSSHYPGNSVEGVSNSGEMIGDNNGPIEKALEPYLSGIPKDPLHDGSIYFYSYDPQHCTDNPIGSCNCAGPVGAVLAFNKAEGTSLRLRKDTCSGGDMNQNNADYNVVFLPAPN